LSENEIIERFRISNSKNDKLNNHFREIHNACFVDIALRVVIISFSSVALVPVSGKLVCNAAFFFLSLIGRV